MKDGGREETPKKTVRHMNTVEKALRDGEKYQTHVKLCRDANLLLQPQKPDGTVGRSGDGRRSVQAQGLPLGHRHSDRFRSTINGRS